MKSIIKILAAAVALCGVITLSGCGNGTPDARVTTNANWNVRTSSKVENNSFDFWTGNKEVATYSVKHFDLAANANPSYFVSFNQDEGTSYRTEFYMEDYDWGWEKIPDDEGFRQADKTEKVYVYETYLSVSGTYKLRGKEDDYSRDFTDSVYSVCKYRLAGDNLQPVYSRQEIKNTTPNALSVNSSGGLSAKEVMDGLSVKVDADYETFYSYDFTKAQVITTSRNSVVESGNNTLEIENKEGYSVFDAAQIRAAIRSFSMGTSATRTFNVAVPQSNSLANCTATISPYLNLTPSQAIPEDEQAQIVHALSNCGDYIFFDGTVDGGDTRLPRYSVASLALNASLKGQTSELWYASVENNSLNTTRGVLLRMIDVMSFNLGYISYSLKSLEIKSV